jgi:hypothetical protein
VREGRKIVFYRDYFTKFYVAQTVKVQEKIEFVFQLIQTVDRVPRKFLEHMTGTDGLYEIRVECESCIYRVFCCIDKGNLELALAIALQKEYLQSKRE